jgi:hypothetical protein
MLQDLRSQLGQSMSSVRQFLQKPIAFHEGRAAVSASTRSPRAQAHEENRKRVRHMKRDLYELLSQHPSTRQLMRRLATVEHTLHADGLEGVEALPVRVIAKALAEMDSLVRDWSPTGLAELRSRMAVIVKSRPAEAASVDSKSDTSFGPASVHTDLAGASADVSEVDHAVFEEMERSWVGVVPAAREPQRSTTA